MEVTTNSRNLCLGQKVRTVKDGKIWWIVGNSWDDPNNPKIILSSKPDDPDADNIDVERNEIEPVKDAPTVFNIEVIRYASREYTVQASSFEEAQRKAIEEAENDLDKWEKEPCWYKVGDFSTDD